MFREARTFDDPTLGTLRRSRGAWRGLVPLTEDLAVRLSVMGKRSGPDPDCRALAGTISDRFAEWHPLIESAILEHAADSGVEVHETPDPAFVAIIELDGIPTAEFGFHVPWDDDHTIGVCIRDDTVVEVNGSILEP